MLIEIWASSVSLEVVNSKGINSWGLNGPEYETPSCKRAKLFPSLIPHGQNTVGSWICDRRNKVI